MKILFASSEVYPFAKTGGLADVAGALPVALEKMGHDVKIVMPKYSLISDAEWKLKRLTGFDVAAEPAPVPVELFSGVVPKSNVEILFLGYDLLQRRKGIYQEKGKDYPDNIEVFSIFCRAILSIPRLLNWPPDILHLNDWQTALVPSYLRYNFRDDPFLRNAATVMTIHNLAFQGIFPGETFPLLGLPEELFTPEYIEYYHQINFLKAGIVFSDVITTVSPTYSREILQPEWGCGLEGLIRKREKRLFGILNGADYEIWNPAQDRSLHRGYSAKALEGKKECKKALQRKCKFAELDVPLIGIISRLTHQKGIDMVADLLDELFLLDLQIIVLGIGEAELEERFKKASERFRDKLSVHLTFEEKFAHRVMAGADILLMPSRFEPCGLSQIYALKYGTLPLARKTGGLADTVIDATPRNLESGKANGFLFETASPHALLTTLRLALSIYPKKPVWNKMVRTAMSSDLSWEHSAAEYLSLYQNVLDLKKSRA